MSGTLQSGENSGAGGTSTMRGIYYQLLWTVLEILKQSSGSDYKITPQKLENPEADGEDEVNLQVIVETVHDADVEVRGRGCRKVVQLKTRKDGTWGIKEVVEEVLGNLIKSVDERWPETEYLFITDGRMGIWGKTYKWMQELKRKGPASYKELDDTLPTFRVDKENCTASVLFSKIVRWLQEMAKEEQDEAVFRAKVWHLIRNFRVLAEEDDEKVKSQVYQFIREHWKREDPLTDNGYEQTSNTMVGELLKIASHPGTTLSLRAFVGNHMGNNSIPINDEHWPKLCENSRKHAIEFLTEGKPLLYRPDWDVRTDIAQQILRYGEKRPLVVLRAGAVI